MGTRAARCSSPKRFDPIGLANGAIAACFQRRFDLGGRQQIYLAGVGGDQECLGPRGFDVSQFLLDIFGMLENRGPLSVSATTKARLAPAMRSMWVLVEHMAPSMHNRSPIQVGPKTPGNDTLAQTACEIGMLLDCERTRRSPV